VDELPAPLREPADPHVISLLKSAGNHATAQALARQPVKTKPKPAVKPAQVKPLTAEEVEDIAADYANAISYARKYFTRVRDVLSLRSQVHDVAIRNFDTFGKLKDPPSLSGAIIAEIFKQVVGLIPGGAAIKAGLAGGFFALDMVSLKKDLEAYPIPGMSLEEERAKGPSDKNKAKAEKLYGRGKTGYDIGKGVYDKVKEVKAKEKEAAEAEASAKELAGLQSGRIQEWTTAIENLQRQEDAVDRWLKDAQRGKKHRGTVEKLVQEKLGPLPDVTQVFRAQLEKQYELALYSQKLEYASVTKYSDYFGTEHPGTPKIALPGGERISSATYRRIAELVGVPGIYELEPMIAEKLNLKRVIRRERIPDPPAGSRVDV
jgi:hypothetical protein